MITLTNLCNNNDHIFVKGLIPKILRPIPSMRFEVEKSAKRVTATSFGWSLTGSSFKAALIEWL